MNMTYILCSLYFIQMFKGHVSVQTWNLKISVNLQRFQLCHNIVRTSAAFNVSNVEEPFGEPQGSGRGSRDCV